MPPGHPSLPAIPSSAEHRLRILFASDLHDLQSAFERYAELLAAGDYSLGVLGGDLVDEWRSDDEVIRLLGVFPDDLLEELPADDSDPIEVWRESEARRLQEQARAARVAELVALLTSVGVPILLVLGNHDRSPWLDSDLITDIHMKRVEVDGHPFVGYRWTVMDREPERRREDMLRLAGLVDRRTILVTHSPAYGVLDGTRLGQPGFGLPELRRIRRRPRFHLVGHVHSAAGVRGRTVNGCWPAIRKFFSIDTATGRVTTVA